MTPVVDLEHVKAAPREELPALAGLIAQADAIVRLRLTEMPSAAVAPPSRVIDGDEMATIAGTSKRTILARTRGLRFRCDLSRKSPRALEDGFRRWLGERR